MRMAARNFLVWFQSFASRTSPRSKGSPHLGAPGRQDGNTTSSSASPSAVLGPAGISCWKLLSGWLGPVTCPDPLLAHH